MDQEEVIRYVNELVGNDRLCQPKVVHVSVGSVDSLEGALNALLGSRRRESNRASGGLPNFIPSTVSNELWSAPKIWGDPWALALVIEDTRALSRRFPLLRFAIHLEDGPSDGVVQNGKLRSSELTYLESWVKEFPRPALDGLFRRLALHCQAEERALAALATSARELAEARADEVALSVIKRPGQLGIDATARTEGARVFAALVRACKCLWFSRTTYEDREDEITPVLSLLFSGGVDWRLRVEHHMVLFALETILAAGLSK